jgi:hypothetical protein
MRDNFTTHYCGRCGRALDALSIWTWALSTVIGIVGGTLIALFIAWALLTVIPW